jgi:ATP-binding cassette, subfamily B, multidrug efflux pump
VLREFRTLVPYARSHGPRYVAGLFFLVLTDGAQLFLPQLTRKAIDQLASGSFALNSILEIAATMCGIGFLVAVGRFFWRYFIQGASRRIEADLRRRLFTHLQSLSSTFYGRNKTGDLMAHMTNDVNAVRMATGMAVVAFVDGLFMTIAILAIMLASNVRLTLLSIAPFPVVTIGVILFGRVVGERFKSVQEGFAAMSDLAQESISGVRVLKTFVQEAAFVRRFAASNNEYAKRNMSLVRAYGAFYPAVSLLAGVTSLIFLISGGSAVIQGAFSPGEFTAFFAYLSMLVWPMMGAGYMINTIQRAGASLERINRILSEQPDIASPPAADRAPPPRAGALRIAGLTYRHPDAERPVLLDIDITVPPGTILGILGRTGAGKTTLVNLLPRVLEPPPGTVFLDGRDVRSYDLADLRRCLSVVPQDTFLFSSTIRDNIAFGVEDDGTGDATAGARSSADALEANLRRAAAISTIERDFRVLPSGWQTVVGERGVTLSGGQKQRVAISRALARDALVYVLDDALSSVDTETEDTILREMLPAVRGRTVILISHRVSTLKAADRIVVLEAGRLTESGTHEELLRARGFYAEIHRLQQLEDAVRSAQ